MAKKIAKIAPLKASLFAISIIGILASILLIPKISQTWAFAFGLVFVIMFIASIVSMIWGPIQKYHS
ncbi:hypothetical protein KY309_02850 [Candidatus Woesearchaeota archaeon]|nr:hypothetical protein [Candidatus Woesearchaeota archaeon]